MMRRAADHAALYREWEQAAPNARIRRYSRILAEAAENFTFMCQREVRGYVQPDVLSGLSNREIEHLLEQQIRTSGTHRDMP